MKKYSISKPRKYIDGQGQERTYWDRVGEMLEWTKQDGSISRVVKIPAIGLEANVFEDKPREAQPSPKPEPSVEYPNEEVVNPADIPDERVSPQDQEIKPDDIPF